MTRGWRDDVVFLPNEFRKPKSVTRSQNRLAGSRVTEAAAESALRGLVPGGHVFMITKEQFSMIDIILALLTRAGDCNFFRF